MPGAVDPELFTRWVEFGAFSPILRTHTTKNPDAERRVWAYPEPYSGILRSTFQMRYALQPYIYTEARRTYDTGVAFFRPLYYDWPEDDAAYTSRGEYVFGDEMLASPVTAPADKATGLASEKVWLPEGDWIEWPTGKNLTGPIEMERKFSIEQTPVYLRAGAIVPMQPPMRYTGAKPVDPLIVNVWPIEPGASSSYKVYEDSGVSVEYQRGVLARTPIKAEESGDTLKVEIGPVEGSYPGMAKTRGYEIRLPADWPPVAVTVNGVAVKQAGPTGKGGWGFEGNTLTTVIPVPSGSVAAKVTVEVYRATGLVARRGEIDGFAGAMTRLRSAYDALQQADPDATPDALIDAMQSGDRLSYHPEQAVDEIGHFREVLPKANGAVGAIEAGFAQRFQDWVKWQMTRNPPPSKADVEAARQSRLAAIGKARSLVDEAGR
jgi:alpha-glucosidase